MTNALHARRSFFHTGFALGGALALGQVAGCGRSGQAASKDLAFVDDDTTTLKSPVKVPSADELRSSAAARARYTEIISRIFGNGLPANRIELGRLARGMKLSISGIGHYAFTIPGNSIEHIKIATTYWAEEFGVGPFVVLESDAQVSQDYYPIDKATGRRVADSLRTQGAKWPAFTALCKADKDYYVEINLQTDDTPSTYRDMFTSDQGGFHHFAVITPQFKADYALMRARFEPTSSLNTSVGAVYFDARKDVGCMFELLETNAALNFLFKSTYALSQNANLADYASSANIKRSDKNKGTDIAGLTYPRISSLVVWSAFEGPLEGTPDGAAMRAYLASLPKK